jgi:MFS family permease
MISKIINSKALKEHKEDIAFGLAVGLAFGLVFGLVAGLAVGLVAGLVAGLAVGLVAGLVAGLAVGLVAGLANLSQLIPLEFLWIIGLILGIILLGELLFNGKGYKSGSKFWFACKRKLESLIESAIIIINTLNIKWLFVEYDLLNKIPYAEILKWIGYIGLGILILEAVLGIFYIWIKLNEYRVRK